MEICVFLEYLKYAGNFLSAYHVRPRDPNDDARSDEDFDDESDAERPNLYAILGVDSAATTSEITRAYRSIAIKHHPDRRRGRANPTGQDDGDEKFVEAQAAYEILKDDAKREFYDAGGSMAEMVRRAT